MWRHHQWPLLSPRCPQFKGALAGTFKILDQTLSETKKAICHFCYLSCLSWGPAIFNIPIRSLIITLGKFTSLIFKYILDKIDIQLSGKKAGQMYGPFLPGAQGGIVGDPTLLARDNVISSISPININACKSLNVNRKCPSTLEIVCVNPPHKEEAEPSKLSTHK